MSTYPFFFNDTATTEIYTLSLHDALPISFRQEEVSFRSGDNTLKGTLVLPGTPGPHPARSEEHTSELQSHLNLVCRLLLEKKKNIHFIKLIMVWLTTVTHTRSIFMNVIDT